MYVCLPHRGRLVAWRPDQVQGNTTSTKLQDCSGPALAVGRVDDATRVHLALVTWRIQFALQQVLHDVRCLAQFAHVLRINSPTPVKLLHSLKILQ